MNLIVPLELHNAFKSMTASQGQSMTNVLLDFIEQYVRQNTPKTPKPKGRR